MSLIYLRGADNSLFCINMEVAKRSGVILGLIEVGDVRPGDEIPLINIDFYVLEAVVHWLNHYYINPYNPAIVAPWSQYFFYKDIHLLASIMAAACDLNILDMIKDMGNIIGLVLRTKTLDELIELFGH
ncbi:S-phase kinase-associated protein 1-like [Teleopsis dalmanni]|uniref:S-phase kinase-associated protein 1-like n=1 Tax=Teleopsis dalmanni TaxID=139649 RepID=UPI0018CDD488|nr:S-phase kinase-associated protein 1-like [Teleopsis dalmanni]